MIVKLKKISVNLLLFALSLSLLNLCYGYDCIIGQETCSCEYIDCNKVYIKPRIYCNSEDYHPVDQNNCNSTDYYFYSVDFCNLTSLTCREITSFEYKPVINSSQEERQEKYSISIRYKIVPVLQKGWFNNLNVTYLDLTYNHIERIDEDAFEGINGLKQLKLAYNYLKEVHFNEMLDLEIFDANTNIIKIVNSTSFSVMPRLKLLILSYNYIEFIASDAFDFNHELKMIDLYSNFLVVLNHFPIMNLIYIDLSNNELKRVENRTFEKLKHIKVIEIDNNQIDKVEKNAFAGLEHLRRIGISSNKLKQLVPLHDIFMLRDYAMIGNLIQVINRQSFERLKNLITLQLNLNKIENIDDFAFDLPFLAKLDLSGNLIYKLHNSSVFYGLTNLKELSLSNNSLTYLSAFTFRHLVNLTILNLDTNLIENISNDSFYGLNKLQQLFLNNNELKWLNKSAFKHLENVVTLELDSNRVTSVDFGGLSDLISLAVLKLRNNKLNFIKRGFFVNLTSLRELYLSNNQISSIHVDSFNTLRSLTILDLRNNNIFKLDQRMFLNLESLKKLDLRQNVIHSINNQTFNFIGNLTELNLTNNLLTILTPGLFSSLTRLRSLNLKHNPIGAIYFDCFMGLGHLRHLLIDDKIKTIIPYSNQQAPFLPKLDSLYFDNVDFQVMRQFNLTQIHTISINFCKMTTNISTQLSGNNIQKIYIRGLDIQNRSLNYYFNEFGENLLEIDLSFNQIDFQMTNQFISRSKNLEKLWMIGVGISNFKRTLDLSIFAKLNFLDLSHNRLEIIQQRYFKFNPGLRHLNLSHNFIRLVEDYSFFSFGNLIVLDLSYNLIEILLDDMFAMYYEELEVIHLNNNRLKEFKSEYRFLSNFISIRLDHNNLTKLPSSIHLTVKVVNDLDLSGNPLGELEPSYFLVTNRVFGLHLRNCSIYVIKTDTFKQLHTLLTLNLSQNYLQKLENNFLSGLESLQILDLSFNQIFFIQNELFERLTRLMHLDLSNNNIYDIEDMAFRNLKSLVFIFLDANPIVNLFNNHTLTGLGQLKYMSISNRVNFTLEIVQSIKNQIKPRLVREVLYMKFYDSVEISFPFDRNKIYMPDVCYYISYLIRNQISLNLEDHDVSYVIKYISDCKDWSTYVYSEKLENFVNSVFN